MANFCNTCGSALHDGAPCGCHTMQPPSILDIFEHYIIPCEGEEKVKAYYVSQLKNRFKWDDEVYADGILTITNKRVIYRTTPNPTTLDFIHSEVPIEDVSGVSIQRGQCPHPKFQPMFGIFLGLIIPVTSWLPLDVALMELGITRFPLLTLIYYLILLAVVCIVSFTKYKEISFASVKKFLKPVFQSPMGVRSLLSLKIVSRGGSSEGISMETSMRGYKKVDTSAEVIPLDDLLVFSQEIGAIINDIQKNGEYTGNINL